MPRAPIVLLLLTLAGCGACGQPRAQGTLLGQLPASSEGVVWLPHPEQLGPKLAQVGRLRVAGLLVNLAGFPDVESLWQALAAQLGGVDLRAPRTLSEAGLAAERGVAWVRLAPTSQGQERVYLVIGVADPKRLEKVIGALAAQRFGASSSSQPGPPGLTVFARPDGAPRVALYQRAGWAFLTAGAAAEQLPAWVASGAAALETAPSWTASLSRLGMDADAYLFAPRSDVGGWPVGAATAALRLERDGVRLQLDLPAGLNPRVAEALAARPLTGASDVSAALPDDAFVLVRFRGDGARLEPVLRQVVSPGMAGALRQLLAQLAPGGMAGLSLSPNAPLGSGVPTFDIQATNPFRYLRLTAVAQVQDEAPVAALLAQLPRLAPQLGARVERRETSAGPRYLTTYAQGEGVSFALSHGVLFAAAPHEQLDAALARFESKAPPRLPPLFQDPAFRTVLDTAALSLVLDVRQLSRSLQALPSGAWGVGGFAVKAVLFRWLDALSELRGVTVGVSAQGRAGQVELAVRWVAPP